MSEAIPFPNGKKQPPALPKMTAQERELWGNSHGLPPGILLVYVSELLAMQNGTRAVVDQLNKWRSLGRSLATTETPEIALERLQAVVTKLDALGAEKERGLPLDEHTKHILGFMAIDCRPYAQMLRAEGVEIPPKIELEQAHVIHWMLGYYLKHGANWRDEAGKQVTAHLAARTPTPETPKEP